MSVKGFLINGEVQHYDYGSLDNVPNDGLSEEVKSAILQLARKVAYVDEHGEDYYQDLYDSFYGDFANVTNLLTNCYSSNISTVTKEGAAYTATIYANPGYSLAGATVSITMGGTDVTGFYSNGTISIPNVTGDLVITVMALSPVSSISAVYTQSGAVYTDGTLDSLKDDLVVTAHYSDSSMQTVPAADYTLSGALTAGTSTITVSYGGKTTTFSVTVTAQLYSVSDFAAQTIDAGGTATVSKTNGIYSISARSAGVIYIYPNATINANKSDTTWFSTVLDKPLLLRVTQIDWNNPYTSDITFQVKFARSDVTGNVIPAQYTMTANNSGTGAEAEYTAESYPRVENLSCIGLQFLRTTGSGQYPSALTASFKFELFIDGVRYL